MKYAKNKSIQEVIAGYSMGKQYMVQRDIANRLDGFMEGVSATKKIEHLLNLKEKMFRNGNYHIVKTIDELKIMYPRMRMSLEIIKVYMIECNNRIEKSNQTHEPPLLLDEAISVFLGKHLTEIENELKRLDYRIDH